MARYFFDIHDGIMVRDDEGQHCASIDDAHKHAKATLLAIALQEVPPDGDRKAYTVLVRDDRNNNVYAGTLSYVGLDLTP